MQPTTLCTTVPRTAEGFDPCRQAAKGLVGHDRSHRLPFRNAGGTGEVGADLCKAEQTGPSKVSSIMFAFIDFEASSLAKKSHPIEVAWVFEDGRSESHLIRPASHWIDWDDEAEAIHGISRPTLERDGASVDLVARRMLDQLGGHDLFATAPSWDGKWLSTLLRGAKLPRHALRLRDTEEAHAETARRILAPVVPAGRLYVEIADLLTLVELRQADRAPAHRALPDALEEQRHWAAVKAEATKIAMRFGDA